MSRTLLLLTEAIVCDMHMIRRQAGAELDQTRDKAARAVDARARNAVRLTE